MEKQTMKELDNDTHNKWNNNNNNNNGRYRYSRVNEKASTFAADLAV